MRLADELATMRLLENDWGEECLRKYHERIPKSAPEEDWDARNALYAMYVATLPGSSQVHNDYSCPLDV
jgi:hypothetical protein